MAYRKIWLKINGADRMLICDPEKDTLADVLRRTGLTGTKLGCKAGQCGACSIMLNGKVVRACVRKMKNIKDYDEILTIEGIGTPNHLHPIQLAWIVYGGVQCGFCTPGFIVSAYALLQENPNPTREEVRAWFQKNRNVCRCTGYKPLVDCVMEAAKVMRGEAKMEDMYFKIPEDGRIYNTHYPRPAALAKVCGTCDYGDDIQLKMPSDTLHAAMVMGKAVHANIKSIDFEEAEKMPGVVKVVTAKDVKGINRITFPLVHGRAKGNGFERPILMDKKVFRYGDVVAVVVADTEAHAREAAKFVKVDLEPLPEYTTVLEAVAPGAEQIHESMPNLYLEAPVFKGEDTRPIMEKSKYVVEGSFYAQREPHLPIEPDVVQGYWDEEGRLTVHCKSLAVGVPPKVLAAGLGLTPDKIRIIENPTGASFGYSISPGNVGIIGACVMAVNRPVTLTMSYEEHQHFSGKRAPAYSNGKLACDENGKITAMEWDLAYDHGAFSETAYTLVEKAQRFMGYPYYIPNIRGLSRIVCTNNAFATSYRGFGSPQAYTCSEALMDMMADKIGIDPFEIRYRNIARDGQTNNNGYPFKIYTMEKIMDMMRPKYEAAVARAKAASTDTKKHGVGIVWGGYNVTSGIDHAEIALELNPDGTVTHYNTWEDQGQGSDIGTLVHTHEALRPLGLTPDQIKIVQADTAICPITGPAASSRSHHMAGMATIDGAKKLMDAMRKPDGTYRTYDEMVAEGIPTKYLGVFDTTGLIVPMDPNTGMGDPSVQQNIGLFMAEVEVDVTTGKTKVLNITAIVDIGILGSKQAVEGQAYGGISHCVGYALSENYDDVKKHKDIYGAGIPYIEDVPDDIEVIYVETPRENGPQGSTGCSEMFQSAGHMAIINGIARATGARVYELPATPDKVKAAIDALKEGKEIKPDKYFLGSDLFEELAEIQANPV